ncbi:hypothetical protein EVAR_75733_1 [Eumeta japonica]|uniref:Uncharacterized protein n=1 Tax=Eumeta variegata TaxID=151549 RepID=A0A4C1TCQ6_EUMVA|nr:hypothetical protein EVAR_75733_1 [Eumeta japonica]
MWHTKLAIFTRYAEKIRSYVEVEETPPKEHVNEADCNPQQEEGDRAGGGAGVQIAGLVSARYTRTAIWK